MLAERTAAIAFDRLSELAVRARAILAPNFQRFEAFMVPRIRAEVSADAFAARLLRDFDTAVVPGRFFQAPAHFRVALGIPAGDLERGLDAIGRALHAGGIA